VLAVHRVMFSPPQQHHKLGRST